MKHEAGLTVIEVIVVIIFLLIAGTVIYTQYQGLEAANRDYRRKTAINAMYYSLEEVFYPANKYYPHTINADRLPSVDPALFTDPSGRRVGDADSEYRYEPTGCNGSEKCQGYVLRVNLEREADYTRISRNTP